MTLSVGWCECVFSCCLLCLSVTVTPGYFCCRGTSSSLLSHLFSCLTASVCLFHSEPLNLFVSFWSIPSLLCLLVHVGCVSVWGLCEVYVSASIMLTIQTRLGQAWTQFLSCVSWMNIASEKASRTRVWPGLGFLILFEATLKEQLLMEKWITGPTCFGGRKLYGAAVINCPALTGFDGKVSVMQCWGSYFETVACQAKSYL